MAEIIAKGDNLNQTIKKSKGRNKFHYLNNFLLLIIAIVLMFSFKQIWIMLIWVIYFLYTDNGYKKSKTHQAYMQAGIKGEDETEKVLRKLPNSYKVFSDVILYNDGRENQLDHIVIGPSGVYVVETKYWTGEIVETRDKNKIMQYKNGQKKEYYHPSRQVETHVRRLGDVLGKNRVRVQVKGLVYFSNKNVVLKAKDIETPLIKDAEELLMYIERNGYEMLSERKMEKIIKIIKKQMK